MPRTCCRLKSSGYQDRLSCGWRAFRLVTILRLRKDSSHSCPLSSRVVLPDLTSPAAATAIATLAAVISSGASYTRLSHFWAATVRCQTRRLVATQSGLSGLARAIIVAGITGGLRRRGDLVSDGMGEGAGRDLMESERDVLLFFLNRVRDAVVRASAGLTGEQQRIRGVPSGTNLLGLIRHLTAVEEHWFQRVFLGQDRRVDMSMDVPASATCDEVVAACRQACARSDEIVRACPALSTMAKAANPGEDRAVSLRRIVVHMIEETARHAGHADILRERIDGATGL